jgi:hypothetical protein
MSWMEQEHRSCMTKLETLEVVSPLVSKIHLLVLKAGEIQSTERLTEQEVLLNTRQPSLQD